MSPPSGERWFHTLVVVGASLAGCGGKTATERGESAPVAVAGSGGSDGSSSTSGAGTAGGSLATPDMCAFDGQFVCDDYTTRKGCHCDLEAPRSNSACQSP